MRASDLPIEVINVLDNIDQPIKASELLDWTYDNLDADLASEYQREIYKYLLHSGKIITEASVNEANMKQINDIATMLNEDIRDNNGMSTNE